MARERLSGSACIPYKLLEQLKHPKPPKEIWQKPFDYFRGHCERIASPSEKTDLYDFLDFFLDYQYMEVQRDLLAYTLPKALEAWARCVLGEPDHEKFTGDWHFEGMWEAFAYRPLYPEFLTLEQFSCVTQFLSDILIERMQQETSLSFQGSNASPYQWISLHATLTCIFPVTECIWERWWSMPASGLAVCGVQWISSLLYESNDNPIFEPWNKYTGGGPPLLFEVDFLRSKPADHAGIEYLRKTLNIEWGRNVLEQAERVLKKHPEYKVIPKMLAEFELQSIILEERIETLINVLERGEGVHMIFDW